MKNTNKNRCRIGFVVKDGYPMCGSNSYNSKGVGRHTVKILSLPEAKKMAKRLGGEWREVKSIFGVDERGFEYSYSIGIDWGTK